MPDDQATAAGRVRIHRAGNVLAQGHAAAVARQRLRGFLPTRATSCWQRCPRRCPADFIDRAGGAPGHLHHLPRDGKQWKPDWVLRADRIDIDQAEGGPARARGAVLEFQGVPPLPVPAISFPLSGQAQERLLPPTFGLDSTNGFE